MLDDFASVFAEPEGFRPPTPPPTFQEFTRKRENLADSTKEVERLWYSLVGQHSLWAHVAWNAGIFMAHYLDSEKERVRGKSVLELGAGAALPSMIAGLNGASWVLATDYPDPDIVQNLISNIRNNFNGNDNISAKGFLWGSDADKLKQTSEFTKHSGFDVILLCDLVFNHNQHENMLRTCAECLAPGGEIYCAFTHHRPWLAHRDTEFLSRAQMEPFQFRVEKIFEEKMDVMFAEDPGDEDVRRTVHGYRLTRIIQQ